MSKERLEEIKRKYGNVSGIVTLDDIDYNYLIEQVERYDECRLDAIKLHEENKRYRETLKFYANKENYKLEHYDPNIKGYMSTVEYDVGITARKALEESK